METLIDPNVAYLLLVGGVLFTLLAIVSPGTGILEIGAAFCLLLAGYAVYQLSFHWWALLILLLAAVPFIYALRNVRRTLMLVLTILCVVLGSVFLFPGAGGALVGVNPLLAALTSLLVGSFLWIALNKSLEAYHRRPRHDLGELVGQVGEAKTDIAAEGSVQAGGELWTARSEQPIPAGSRVRILRREGFILVVEKLE